MPSGDRKHTSGPLPASVWTVLLSALLATIVLTHFHLSRACITEKSASGFLKPKLPYCLLKEDVSSINQTSGREVKFLSLSSAKMRRGEDMKRPESKFMTEGSELTKKPDLHCQNCPKNVSQWRSLRFSFKLFLTHPLPVGQDLGKVSNTHVTSHECFCVGTKGRGLHSESVEQMGEKS